MAAWCQVVLALQLGRAAWTSDFRVYYTAARIGVTEGWNRIYDAGEQVRIMNQVWGASPLRFISMPVDAWLLAPLTALPPQVAFAIFAAVAWGSLVLASQLASPKDLWSRSLFALLALGSLPAAATITFGQVSGLVMLCVIASWRLLQADRQVWAGIALAGIALKPQLAILAPAVLLIAGRWRALGAFAGACLVLALASVVLVGVAGLGQMLELQKYYVQEGSNQVLSLRAMLGSGIPTFLIDLAVVSVALAPAWFLRHRDLGPALAAAVAGSLLANVYLHGMDAAVYLFPVWLALRQPGVWVRGLGVLLWLSLNVAVTRSWVTALVAAALIVTFATVSAGEARPRAAGGRPSAAGGRPNKRFALNHIRPSQA